jgi:hypothetical protein
MIGQPKPVRKRSRRSGLRKERSGVPRRQVGVTAELAVLYGAQEIRRRVHQLALQMNQDYAGTTLHLVGILERSFVFIADLVRQLEVPVVCHFLRAIVQDELLDGVALRRISYGPELRLSLAEHGDTEHLWWQTGDNLFDSQILGIRIVLVGKGGSENPNGLGCGFPHFIFIDEL